MKYVYKCVPILEGYTTLDIVNILGVNGEEGWNVCCTIPPPIDKTPDCRCILIFSRGAEYTVYAASTNITFLGGDECVGY